VRIRGLRRGRLIERGAHRAAGWAERNVLMQNVKHPFLVSLRYSFQTAVRGGPAPRLRLAQWAGADDVGHGG
jgi:hypothetical protein